MFWLHVLHVMQYNAPISEHLPSSTQQSLSLYWHPCFLWVSMTLRPKVTGTPPSSVTSLLSPLLALPIFSLIILASFPSGVAWHEITDLVSPDRNQVAADRPPLSSFVLIISFLVRNNYSLFPSDTSLAFVCVCLFIYSFTKIAFAWYILVEFKKMFLV